MIKDPGGISVVVRDLRKGDAGASESEKKKRASRGQREKEGLEMLSGQL